MQQIYLDHNATTPVDDRVLRTMQRYFNHEFANASSPHGPGQKARMAVDQSRREIARLLGCESGEVLFTSGGTEGDNLALLGVGRAHRFKGHAVLGAVEHKAVLEAAAILEELGMDITLVPATPDGVVEAGAMIAAFREDTRIVSLMLANNETGTLQPVAEVAAAAGERGIVVLCDAVQAMGKVPVRPHELGVDLLVLSGHKIYGPKGVGVLYQRYGTRLAPMIVGGQQEYGKRGGTTNVPLIAGMAEAMRLIVEEGPELIERAGDLAGRFLRDIQEATEGVRVNGDGNGRLANTLNLAFEGVHGASLVQALDMAGVHVSTGSACMSGSSEPSHVLRGMGLGDERARSSVRFSFGRLNDEEQVERAVRVVAESVSRLRANPGNGSGNGNGGNGGNGRRGAHGPLNGPGGTGW